MKETGTIIWNPELRYTANGAILCTFSIVTSTQTINCDAWGDFGKVIAQQHEKYKAGVKVTVTGRTKERKYFSALQNKQVTRKTFNINSITVAE